MSTNLSNEKKLIGLLQAIVINESNHIMIGEYEKRGNEFFDVIFYNNKKEIFLGRFNKDFSKITSKYNNGKILICVENVIGNDINAITNVLSLYDIVDDTFYSTTESEALKLFDQSINTTYLKNKDNLIAKEDIEKKNHLKVKSKV